MTSDSAIADVSQNRGVESAGATNDTAIDVTMKQAPIANVQVRMTKAVSVL